MNSSGLLALLALLAALYAATDPLKLGPVAKFPQFSAKHIPQPTTPSELAASAPRSDPANRLTHAQLRFVNQICGPESIAFDPLGRGPYSGLCDGQIVRYDGPEKGWTQFSYTSPNRSACPTLKSPNLPNEPLCGRPLGLRFKKSTSELYIADAYKGLLVVGPEGGAAKPLLTEVEGEPLGFTNDLDFDEDGVVYFTDTSTKYQRRNFMLPILEGDNSGRLIKYNPSTKQAVVLLRGLQFPNGVSMSKDFSFLVFAESTNGRLTRYWLKGPKAGTSELFALLPGHPDNVRTNSNGEFWVAMHAVRKPVMRMLGPRPKLREALLRLPLPAKLVYKLVTGSPYGLVLKYDAEGNLLDALEDRTGAVTKSVSEVEEHDGYLWMGSVLYNQIAVYKL